VKVFVDSRGYYLLADEIVVPVGYTLRQDDNGMVIYGGMATPVTAAERVVTHDLVATQWQEKPVTRGIWANPRIVSSWCTLTRERDVTAVTEAFTMTVYKAITRYVTVKTSVTRKPVTRRVTANTAEVTRYLTAEKNISATAESPVTAVSRPVTEQSKDVTRAVTVNTASVTADKITATKSVTRPQTCFTKIYERTV